MEGEKLSSNPNRRLVTSVSPKTDYLVVGKLLDDNRQVTNGNKYKKAIQFGKKVMTEREFEQFCRVRFANPDFILGRMRKKDTTIQSEDVLILDDSDKDLLDEITDITDLIGST